jgi:hypothetical protein
MVRGARLAYRWFIDVGMPPLRAKRGLFPGVLVRYAERVTAGGRSPFPVRDAPGRRYLIRLNTWKIGMYKAMIIDPMMPPRTAIMSGSIRLVRASVVASTSWS